MHYGVLALVAVAIYVLKNLIDYFQTRAQNARDARAWGCQSAPILYDNDFMGRRFLREFREADERKNVTGLVVDRAKHMSAREGRPCHTFQYTVFGTSEVATFDPKNIQALLATQFKDFELGPSRKYNLGGMFGLGIFTQNGQEWEHSRGMLRPNFVRDQVNDIDALERHVQHFFRALPTDKAGWTGEVDLQVLFFRQTLDYATEFLFGESVDSQLNELPENADKVARNTDVTRDERAFAWAFDRGQWWLAQRDRRRALYWTVGGSEYKKCVKITQDFADHFVRLALKKDRKPLSSSTDTEKGNKPRYVFLDALAEQTQDPIELRAQLLNILLAGRDTTASLLSFVFLLLARHPKVFKKLREAVLNDFGTYEDSREIDFASLKSCSYLQSVMNETLRMFPVVPLNARHAAKNTTLPRGGGPDGQSPVFIAKGQRVTYSVHVMHRQAEFWPGYTAEQLETFDPERWEGGAARRGWEFLPFNGGPRICIGQQFALTEAGYVIVRILQKFQGLQGLGPETTVAEGAAGVGDHIRQNQTLINCPADGVRVKLQLA